MKTRYNIRINNDFEMLILHGDDGYIVTVNKLEDGEVIFGCSGEYRKNIFNAATTAMANFVDTWPEASFPEHEIDELLLQFVA